MALSKTGTMTVRQELPVQRMDSEFTVKHGDIMIHEYGGEIIQSKAIEDRLYKATMFVPNGAVTFYSSTGIVEMVPSNSMRTLTAEYKQMTNKEEIEYVRNRILTAVRMSLANVQSCVEK